MRIISVAKISKFQIMIISEPESKIGRFLVSFLLFASARCGNVEPS